MENVSNFIDIIDELPTLPTIFTVLSDVMSNPWSTALDVANVITQDQSAASKILKTANSSIYGFRGRISTVSEAISFIGFEEVKNLVLALSIINMFGTDSMRPGLNPVKLWKHSIAVGVISRFLGKTIGIKNLENYFIAGILHDIGKLVFFKYIPDEYAKALEYCSDNSVPAKDGEQATLGITHTIIGEMIADKWKLPSSLKEPIKYHTMGMVEGKHVPLVAAVHVADITAKFISCNLGECEIAPEPNYEVWEDIALPDNFFTDHLKIIRTQYVESINLLLKN
ncbi:MAG: HDOD domain-containing protein [Chloroflexota bacterium]